MLDQLLLGRSGVLQNVVQQGSLDRRGVELPLGEDLGNRNRVRDIGLARAPELAQVGGVGEAVGLFDAGDVGGREVAADAFGEVAGRGHAARGRLRRRRAPDGAFESLGGAACETGSRRRWVGVLGRHEPGACVRVRDSMKGPRVLATQVGTLRSISRPTLLAAISRRAATGALSLVSTLGVWPWASWRAR
ncbi:hypothetical protein SDC9_189772 [bioreactor metagenome]|uniref:Uncharacterized protein n=1 Tax=bioreactor metagenome TaxID=1076179 RepID=A0A645HUF7_9ZZZZ